LPQRETDRRSKGQYYKETERQTDKLKKDNPKFKPQICRKDLSWCRPKSPLALNRRLKFIDTFKMRHPQFWEMAMILVNFLLSDGKQTETDRDRQRQTETDRDRQRQTETDRHRQRQTETDRWD
jgi:hypothetical protein